MFHWAEDPDHPSMASRQLGRRQKCMTFFEKIISTRMKESHGISLSSEGFSCILVFGRYSTLYMTNPFWWLIQLIHLEGQVTHPHEHHWNPHPHLSLPPLPWLGAVVFEDGSILTVFQFESIKVCLPHTLFPVELTPGAGRCKTHAPAIGRYKQSGARPRRVTGPIGASERVAKSTGQCVQSNASRFLPCRSFEVAIVVAHHLQPPVRPLPPKKKVIHG